MLFNFIKQIAKERTDYVTLRVAADWCEENDKVNELDRLTYRLQLISEECHRRWTSITTEYGEGYRDVYHYRYIKWVRFFLAGSAIQREIARRIDV